MEVKQFDWMIGLIDACYPPTPPPSFHYPLSPIYRYSNLLQFPPLPLLHHHAVLDACYDSGRWDLAHLSRHCHFHFSTCLSAFPLLAGVILGKPKPKGLPTKVSRWLYIA